MLRAFLLKFLIPLLVAPVARQDDPTALSSLLSSPLRVPAGMYVVESS